MHAFSVVIITILYSQDLHLTIIHCIYFPICVIFGCFPFWGDGSVVVDLLFYVPLIVCGGPLFGLCFGMHYF